VNGERRRLDTTFGRRVRVVQRSGRLDVAITGDLDAACLDDLTPQLPVVRRFHAGEIVVDCSAVTSIDMAGLDILLAISVEARPGGQVTLVNPTASVLELLPLAKANHIFAIQVDLR
jgi:anti-anti-sigma factor